MTESASRRYFETVDIHDRTYQKFSIDNDIYHIPVDEKEEDRLDVQHRVFQWVFDGKLFFPPLQYPRRILDCGYGQGQWAVTMAQTYYQSEYLGICHVTAIDIWPADLAEEPDNLAREIWNLNDPLSPTYRTSHYDLIHSRCVAPGIKKDRWQSYVRDLVRLLKRDGWLQMVEYYYIIQSDSGRLNDDHALQQWGQAYRGAMERDRDLRIGRSLAEKMRAAGLRDVHSRSFQVPIGDWPEDPRLKQIGILNLGHVDDMLDAHAIWPFTQRLGWTREQVGWLTDRARQEARDASLRLYMPLYVAWGRKR